MRIGSFEERLLGSAHSQPPVDLRGRVLAAAAPLVRPGVTWSDRLWFSRRWRLAAAALFVSLVALDHFAAGPAVAPRAVAPLIGLDAARAVADAARESGLPADQVALLSKRAFDAATRSAKRQEVLPRDADAVTAVQ